MTDSSQDHLDAQYPDRQFFVYRERFIAHLLKGVHAHLTRDGLSETRCLDIGSNTGRYTDLLSQSGLAVEGVDFSDDLLATARSRHPQHRFHQGDAQALPFLDNTFDGVISLGLVQMVPDWAAAVRETVRVLKPGGVAVIETNRRFPAWEYGLKHAMYCLTGSVDRDARASVLNAHRLGPKAPNGALRKFSPEDLLAVLETCGSIDVQMHLPRKHVLLHDFVFAVQVIKRDDASDACTALPACSRCRGGIATLPEDS
jgi:ubiquinone/menaquinone biosynthesis C-methylase UbiE